MHVPSWRLLSVTPVASLILLAGCGNASGPDGGSGSATQASQSPVSSSAIPVVASTSVYGDVVEQIGGGEVEVTSIITSPDQDPHSYEASTRDQLALSEAEVVVQNGGGYDEFIDRMLRTSDNTSAEVVDAVEVSGKTAPPDGELNEHVWYDFPTMGRVAERIAAALGSIAPSDADTFTRNAEDFKAGLRSLEEKEAGVDADHGGEPVAVTEPVPLYLTEACGLVDRTPDEFSEAVEEGHDVSPAVLQETLDLFTGDPDDRVEVLVYNEQTTGPQTERVEQAARDAGVPVVPVTETLPDGEDYLGWMNANVDALAGALDR
ncbi:metal ABC transporter solute-binding protein, Zn/Mn family [Streptomyces poriticola]|uniref:metal ABC transporter solute-binding protein, Zn/Mn family n=1 Tax=Streptomyces poriticola TaxID=3120506 RepID=UPI002FCE1AB9